MEKNRVAFFVNIKKLGNFFWKCVHRPSDEHEAGWAKRQRGRTPSGGEVEYEYEN